VNSLELDTFSAAVNTHLVLETSAINFTEKKAIPGDMSTSLTGLDENKVLNYCRFERPDVRCCASLSLCFSSADYETVA